MNMPALWWPVHRLLERHLSRLRDNLEDLAERLREALAQAVSKAVAGAVREVVHRLTLPAGLPEASGHGFEPAWERDERQGWNNDGDRSPWRQNPYEDDEPLDDEELETTQPSIASAPSRWLRATAVGLQAAAWLLRRRLGQFPLAAALGLGLLATTGVYFTSPALLAAGAGVAGVAFGVLNLVETATSV